MNILIVGAGPAGLASAIFLGNQGHKITLIEKAKEFTTMGFGILFFNEGKKLLWQATHDEGFRALLKQVGVKTYFDEEGNVLGNVHYNSIFHLNSHDSLTSIKREDLHNFLHQHLPKNVDLQMGTTICTIVNTTEYADVRLSNGTEERYDLVVSAEGTHSQLRDMFFTYKVKTLPLTTRYFWIDTVVPHFSLEMSADATILLLPHREKSTVLAIESPAVVEYAHEHGLPPPQLVDFYESVGITKDVLHNAYSHGHVSSMRYVQTKGWHKNRVVLIGDAAHAMTPTFGVGTSLALDDAYHLACALETITGTHAVEKALKAFARKRTGKIRMMRAINKLGDFMCYKKSKYYYLFWYKFRRIALKLSIGLDYLVRFGWRYS